MSNTDTSRYAIGADIGGSHISSAVVDLTAGQICTEPVTTPVDSCSAAETIINAWSRNLTETLSSSNREIEGIGIAIPGPFDYSRGISLITGVCKFETLFGLDVKQSLLGRLNSSVVKKIRFINDASAFALGESLGGSARDCTTVMALTLGTGVGSGFVRDNELIESGQDVPANGWVYCLPFEDSIADDAFSTRWFIKRYRELTGQDVNGAQEVAMRCDTDPAARQLFNEFGSRLARFAMPLLEHFGCETLVLGGNIARSYDLFSSAMKGTFAQSGKIINTKVSSLMDKAALVGAASLFKKHIEK